MAEGKALPEEDGDGENGRWRGERWRGASEKRAGADTERDERSVRAFAA